MSDEGKPYDLGRDPHELEKRAREPARTDRLAEMRCRPIAETARFGDPLRDCVSKFNGIWQTGSGQVDVTRVQAA
jgi:hypothetical protein